MKLLCGLATAVTADQTIGQQRQRSMVAAIGIAVHRDGCVAYHTKMMAHQHGATQIEVAATAARLAIIRWAARRRCIMTRCAMTTHAIGDAPADAARPMTSKSRPQTPLRCSDRGPATVLHRGRRPAGLRQRSTRLTPGVALLVSTDPAQSRRFP